MNFDDKCHEILRNWYADGRIYYHKVIDIKAPEEGIKEIKTVLSFSPAIKRVTAFELPEENGTYDVIDLESTKKASLGISLSAVPQTGFNASDILSTLENTSNSLLNKFGKLDSLNLESVSNNTGEAESLSLSSKYSFDSQNTVFVGLNYNQVETFEV